MPFNMPSLFTLTLAAMAASLLVAADPAPEMVGQTRSAGLTSSLKTVRNINPTSDVPSGLVQHARGLARRGSAIPESLVQALVRRTTGSAGNSADLNAGQWITEAEFGTPPQKLPIILDTGSWDCVVFSSQSNKTLLPAGTLVYEPDKSRTAKLLNGSSFRILYGSGDDEANGDVYRDVLTIGGVTTASQAVESVVNFTSVFTELGSSGIVGMAQSKNNTVRPIKQQTFFHNIKDELAMPVLTANLYLSVEGSFDFGFINESLIDGSVTWADVDTDDSQQGWWSIPVDGYQVGSGPFVTSPFLAIVDTGTSVLLFPQPVVSAYYAQVPGAWNSAEFGGFVFPCNETLPDFDITISGRRFTVSSDLLNLGEVNNATCLGNMQTVPPPVVPDLLQPTAVIGATFMLSHLIAFDLGKLQVGIAQKRFIENATWTSV